MRPMPLPNKVPRCYQVSFGMNVPEPRLGMAQCLIGTEAPALTFIALKGWPMAGKEVMPIDSVMELRVLTYDFLGDSPEATLLDSIQK